MKPRLSERELIFWGIAGAVLGLLAWVVICWGISAGLARGQAAPPDVLRPWGGFTVRISVPAASERLECVLLSLPESTVAALTLEIPIPTEATLPIALPGASLRCRACNAIGCSELSPNAVVIDQRSRADCTADGVTNVSDIVCVGRVIFGGQP